MGEYGGESRIGDGKGFPLCREVFERLSTFRYLNQNHVICTGSPEEAMSLNLT